MKPLLIRYVVLTSENDPWSWATKLSCIMMMCIIFYISASWWRFFVIFEYLTLAISLGCIMMQHHFEPRNCLCNGCRPFIFQKMKIPGVSCLLSKNFAANSDSGWSVQPGAFGAWPAISFWSALHPECCSVDVTVGIRSWLRSWLRIVRKFAGTRSGDLGPSFYLCRCKTATREPISTS